MKKRVWMTTNEDRMNADGGVDAYFFELLNRIVTEKKAEHNAKKTKTSRARSTCTTTNE